MSESRTGEAAYSSRLIASSLMAASVTLALFVLAESVRIMDSGPRGGVAALLPLAGLAVPAALWHFAAPVAHHVLCASVSATRVGGKQATSLKLALIGLLSIALAVTQYRILVIYPPFQGYPPFVAAFSALALFVTAAHAIFVGSRGTRGLWIARMSCAVGGLGGGVAIYLANYRVNVGSYPTLHLAILQVAFVLVQIGLFAVALTIPVRVRWLRAGGVAVLCWMAVSVVYSRGSAGDRWRPYFQGGAVLGRSAIVYRHYDPNQEVVTTPVPPDGEAVMRFDRFSGLPALPEDFVLDDHNILLIVIEATRYDRTTLADPGLATTPNLAEFARDAVVFTRAYAPSSGTLHAMAAVHSGAFPSLIPLETWMRPWHGELHGEVDTVAEVLKTSGWSTFAVTHNYDSVFDDGILGIYQGIDEVVRVHTSGSDTHADTDALIASAAVEALENVGRSEKRFFGWVFFVSPHSPYVSHGYAQIPDSTAADRYLQELRYADEQLGVVLKSLRDAGLADETIVIVMSDHGEEFQEHGGARHKSTVYVESTHVPLVIKVPGLAPARLHAPVSTVYPLLWLMLSSRAPEAREMAERQLSEVIGPVMRETGNAVLIELVGYDRMKSALVWQDYKLNYDFIARLYELYHLPSDPYEQRDLLEARTDVASELTGRFERYRSLRAGRRKFILSPDKDRTRARSR